MIFATNPSLHFDELSTSDKLSTSDRLRTGFTNYHELKPKKEKLVKIRVIRGKEEKSVKAVSTSKFVQFVAEKKNQ